MAKATSKFRKARTSSIYRGVERLLGDLMHISERIPKSSYGLQAVGGRMVGEAIDALAATEYALNSPDLDQRIAYIGSLIHSMTVIKSCCRQIYAYSRKEVRNTVSNDGEVKIVTTPTYGRIISSAQYSGLLVTFGKLGMETGKWFKASQTARSKGMGNATM